MTEYEPGTVAAITLTNGALIGRALRTSDRGWRVPSCGDFHYDREVADVRPLVVLDLENPAEVVRVLVSIANRHLGSGSLEERVIDNLADEIEAQTRRPKPAEPTGRYAVVEDEAGVEWVRADPGYGYCWKALTTDQWSDWDSIDVAEIHTEGKQ